ncbi:hypothetical protein H920_08043 [Fukomys damarensis]|uniref:Uncharacterized protein n=1 Tax=Fukomys damarensis TaxID=885580 RepID=A0A091DJ32_FUKDA|nr:hypothetical protein H920_08043 [Fukomys damarensis]
MSSASETKVQDSVTGSGHKGGEAGIQTMSSASWLQGTRTSPEPGEGGTRDDQKRAFESKTRRHSESKQDWAAVKRPQVPGRHADPDGQLPSLATKEMDYHHSRFTVEWIVLRNEGMLCFRCSGAEPCSGFGTGKAVCGNPISTPASDKEAQGAGKPSQFQEGLDLEEGDISWDWRRIDLGQSHSQLLSTSATIQDLVRLHQGQQSWPSAALPGVKTRRAQIVQREHFSPKQRLPCLELRTQAGCGVITSWPWYTQHICREAHSWKETLLLILKALSSFGQTEEAQQKIL